MTELGEVGGGSSLTEHLLNGVAGDEVYQEEDERDDDPDYGKGQKDAGEDRLHCLFQDNASD